MAMPKLFGQVLEKLDGLGTVIAMLQRVEAKVDKLIALLEAEAPAASVAKATARGGSQMQPSQAGTMPKDEPIMQVDETTANKMQAAGDFAPVKGKK